MLSLDKHFCPFSHANNTQYKIGNLHEKGWQDLTFALVFANLGNNFALVFNEVRESSISFFCPLQSFAAFGVSRNVYIVGYNILVVASPESTG